MRPGRRGGGVSTLGTLRRALLILAAALILPAQAAQPPSGLAAKFGALPQRTDVTLSSSGRMLAWLQPSDSGDEVVAFDIGSQTVRRMLQMPAGLRVYWLAWEDDDTLLVGASRTEQVPASLRLNWGRAVRWSRVLALDVPSGKSFILLGNTLSGDAGAYQTGAGLLAWAIPGQPHTVIMTADVESIGRYRPSLGTMIHNARGDSGLVSTVFAVDSATGKAETIASGDAFTNQWVLDENGNPVARTEWQSDRYTVYARQGDDWRQIWQHPGTRAEFGRFAFDSKSRALLTIAPDANGRRRLWAIPLDGSAPRRLLPDVSQEVMSFAFDPATHSLSAVWVGRSDEHRIWIDTAAQARYESIARAFPGRQVRVYDLSQDGRETLAAVQAISAPPVYYLINFANHSAAIAGEAYPQLAHVTLGTAHSIQYQTQDGRTVRAQVVLPPGGGKNLPLVVLAPGELAGGSNDFDWFAQYLAMRGYAVLRPDLALTGLPTEGGWVGWGGASQRYAVDGISLLVQQGIADPHRVCIVGAGYGGYAALAGAAFFPDKYACAVSINGITDLRSFLGHEIDVFGGADSNHVALAAWESSVGSQSDPKVIAESPVHAAKAVVAPVLLLHGSDDTVVPVEQSLEMKRALEKAGKRVTFIQLDGSDHWLDRASTRIEVLKSVGQFLQASLH